MIFEPELRVEVPTTDVVSYIFSNPDYDHDEPMYTDVHNPSRSISYNQAHSIIRKLVAGLRAWGVRPGDCVAIHSFNDIYYSMLVLAIVGAGGVYTGTNPAYTTPELAHHFKASQTRFVLSEPELLGPLKAAMEDAQIAPTSLRIFNTQPDQKVPAGERSWNDLLHAGEQDWVRFDDLKRSSETTAARLFSSGTTGLPKAVAITHRNLIAQHHLVFEQNPRPDPVSRVVAIPVFHAAAAPSTHFGSLRAGHRIFMMRRFDLGLYLSTNEKYQITDATVVPPIVIAILMTPASHTRPWLKSIRAAAVGAAPLDKDAQAKFRALIGEDAPCTQVWGMTETCCIGTKFSYPEHDDTGSVGRLIPNLQAKLVDDEGNNISAWGVRGELCVRGPTVTPGYFNNPQANADSFDRDGWFHTGDIAYCDEATRKWYIVDRKKELIKVRGFQVAPPELEAALLAHPQIIDAAVIGLTGVLPDSELPRAYVVRRPGTGDDLTEKDVQTYMAERLAKYKALTGGVKFVPAIPKNASGKILKRVLREESQKEIKAGNGPKL